MARGKKKKPDWAGYFAKKTLFLVMFLGLLIVSFGVHAWAFKYKTYFSPESGGQTETEDAFRQGCPKFFCGVGWYDGNRQGWETSCTCFRPNVANYVLAPVLAVLELKNWGWPQIGGLTVMGRVTPLGWLLQTAYIFGVTSGLMYLWEKRRIKTTG